MKIDPMDPLCISLVREYLDSSKSDLADQFKIKYQPEMTSVTLKEVMFKWKEEQLARGLVYQHLRKVAPALAFEFANSYQCPSERVSKQLVGLIEEEQLARCLVFQHLNRVTPALALEFRDCYHCSLESVPEKVKQLIAEALRDIQAAVETERVNKVNVGCDKKQEQNNNRQRLGMKVNTFTVEEVRRIENAVANKESISALAKQLGRSYKSVLNKTQSLQRAASTVKGRFTAAENERIRQALANNEDFKQVAKELGRVPKFVSTKMLRMKCNPNPLRRRNFSLQDHLLILEKVIPRLKYQSLSSTGFLSLAVLMELANELQRDFEGLRLQWEQSLQPWLLQHYTGTTGLRVERMLTCLVAQNFSDHRGVDWTEIVRKHQEFAGHTPASLRRLFYGCLDRAKQKQKAGDVSLQEVAEYAVEAYQPGKERKESAAKIAHREKIILYFKRRVEELGINILV